MGGAWGIRVGGGARSADRAQPWRAGGDGPLWRSPGTAHPSRLPGLVLPASQCSLCGVALDTQPVDTPLECPLPNCLFLPHFPLMLNVYFNSKVPVIETCKTAPWPVGLDQALQPMVTLHPSELLREGEQGWGAEKPYPCGRSPPHTLDPQGTSHCRRGREAGCCSWRNYLS